MENVHMYRRHLWRMCACTGDIYGESAHVPEINLKFRSLRTTFNKFNILVDKNSLSNKFFVKFEAVTMQRSRLLCR